MELILAFVGGLLGCTAIWYFVDQGRRRRAHDAEQSTHDTAARIVEEARKEGEALRREAELQAKEVVLRAKNDAERDAKEQRREIGAAERRVAQKEEAVGKRLESITERERELQRRDDDAKRRDEQLAKLRIEEEQLVEAVRKKLEETAGLTRDEARRALIEQMTEEARHDASKTIRQIEGEAREEGDRRAKKIVAIAIERLAGEYVAERTVSVVALPNDDM